MSTEIQDSKETYGAKHIKVLEGLEAVRLRPAMYIGSTSKDGLHHLVYEVVDNSVDECLAGVCTAIKVSINKDGSVSVEDNGRGMPVDLHPVYKKSAMEIIVTKLHAGGKFDKKAYAVSGGLHGVGISVVAALSTHMRVEVKKDGKIYMQEYKIGKPLADVKVIGSCEKGTNGTKVTFMPDAEIFSTTKFDFTTLATRFREMAFLNAGLKIMFSDENTGKKEDFHFVGGLVEFVKWLDKSRSSLHKPIYFKRQAENDLIVEIAFEYTDTYNENIFGFVNTINTVEGGTHVSGFKTALTRVINDYATKKGTLKSGDKLEGDDVREGLTAVISLRLREPQFEGQTKTKLGNSEVKGIVDSTVTTVLTEFFEENPDIAKKIIEKASAAAKARDAAKKARDLIRRKSVVGFSGLPGKLADCSSKKFEKTELYIVEGDSAAGCFSGETKVALADGRSLSFKELVKEYKNGKENFCYTIKENGSIGIEKIESPRVTRMNAEVIKVILDNDEEIICTPNHKFMLRNGNFKEAKDLIKEDSLMPLYLEVTIKNNHKIKKIEFLNKKIDVYDLEVSETHNFALASGIFVHNSSKMARDKEFQAILPLKGKIMNVEKANPVKVLSSEEIINLITAIGTGIKENFAIDKLRYNKVIIMSVDGGEGIFIENPNGMISFVKVGNFIDNIIKEEIDPGKFKVLCFSLKSGKTQFKNIKAIIKHPIEEKLYEIKTSYGRKVKITSSHSIFIYENNEIKLKKGSEISKGDKVVAPQNLPLFNINNIDKIDVLSILIKNKENINEEVYIRGSSVESLLKSKVRESFKDNNEFIDERIKIPKEFGKILEEKRKVKNLSQKFICERVGVKQPCIYYDWEKGKNNPTRKNFERYLKVLEINKDEAISQVQVMKPKLDQIWETQYSNSGRNKVKDYIPLSMIKKEDLSQLDDDVIICPTHYKSKGIPRFININEDFAKLAGFWVAEGSCSQRNGLRFAIGNYNKAYITEFQTAIKNVFGLEPKMTPFSRNCAELKLVNRVVSLAWKCLFGFYEYSSETKKIPDIIFNLNHQKQLEFLRGYLLGDGTICKNGISFTTTSEDLANQLMYLLLSFGVISGVNVKKPIVDTKKPIAKDDIISKNTAYIVSITARDDLIKLKRIWESHRNFDYLNAKINSKFPSINKRYEKVSDDLVALEVKNIKEVISSNGDVYDFSVDEDENFIAGFGGLCCHNTDADVDGQHIRTLLLTFFFRYVPELIENGNVYVAMSPLYRIRKGKDLYVYSDEELEKALKQFGGKADVQRFKGLGEMNPIQLWDTTMDPAKRILKKIVIEDAVKANETFEMLMGDVVGPRRKFIETNANIAELDI